MTAGDLMLILRLILGYQCAKAVLDEALNYAPHNEAPVLAQPSPEELGNRSEEIASPESQGVVSENGAAFMTDTDEELGSLHKTRSAYSV